MDTQGPIIRLARVAVLAQVIWLLVSAAAVFLTLSGAGALYQELSLPCEAQTEPEYCQGREQGLGEVGISKEFYVSIVTLGVLVELLPWFIVGGFIFWKKSGKVFGFVFSLMVMLQGMTAIDPAISQWAVFAFPKLEWLVIGIEFLGMTLLAAWYFFPDGRLARREFGWLAALWVLRVVGGAFFPGSTLDSDSWPEPWPLVIVLALVGTLIYSILHPYQQTKDRVYRSQIRNVVLSGVLLGGIYIIQRLVFANLETHTQIIRAQMNLVLVYYLASGAFAASILIAILRYRLFDIQVVVRKTLVYSVLTLLLGLVYLSSVTGLQAVFTALTGAQSAAALVISTLAIAALFNPLRTRIQDFIDRRFYRKKYDAEQALTRFAATARDEVDMEKLSAVLLGVVDETMQPEQASLWINNK